MFWRVTNTVVRTMRSNLPAKVWLSFFSDPIRLEETIPGVISVNPHDDSTDDEQGRKMYSIRAKTYALCGLTVSFKSQMGGPLKPGEQELLDEALVIPHPNAIVALRCETWSPHFTHSLAIYMVEPLETGGCIVSEMLSFRCPIWSFFPVKAECNTMHGNLLRLYEDDIRARSTVIKEGGHREKILLRTQDKLALQF